MVLRRLRPAPLQEGTVPRREAVVADRDPRKRPGEHRELRGELRRQVEQERFDPRTHVFTHEQIAQVGVRAGPVQVHHLGARDVHPRTPGHVHLDRHVADVLRLHLGRGLHLDRGEARAFALEDVDRAKHPLRKEGRLVDPARAVAQRRSRRPHSLEVGVVGEVDEHAARRVVARQLAHLPALVQDELGCGVALG